MITISINQFSGMSNAVKSFDGHKKTFATAKAKFSSVVFGGVEYALTQNAYMDNYGTEGEVRYYATAIDNLGNEYKVRWETTLEWDAASKVASLEFRGEVPDLEAIADEFGVDVDGFAKLDLNAEEYACNWDSPVAVNPV